MNTLQQKPRLRLLAGLVLACIVAFGTNPSTALAQCTTYHVSVWYFGAGDFSSLTGVPVTANWSAPASPTTTIEANWINGDNDYTKPVGASLQSATVFGVTVNMGQTGHACVRSASNPNIWVCLCISVTTDPTTGCPVIHIAECSQSVGCPTATCP